MTPTDFLFTSESVSEGHPDKVCDRISDEIVDLYFREALKGGYDPAKVRVACEAASTTNRVALLGEMRGPDSITSDMVEDVVRNAVKDIGYEQQGFHWKNLELHNWLHGQSIDIADGVDEGTGTFKEEGAGDQGIMFGYASNETRELMPAPIMFAHRLGRALTKIRKAGKLAPWLRPDAKSQVSVQYVDGKPVRIVNVVISTQHAAGVAHKTIEKFCIEEVIKKVLPKSMIDNKTEFLINPTGNFVVGGPQGDSGLTGRKIIVDTYGGMGRHGGGAFSGKDPSKVDRSAAYMGRWVAKNVVAAGLAEKCEVQFAYAIGHPKPTSVHIDTFGTGSISDKKILKAVLKVFSFKPADIVSQLKLLRPIYSKTTNYGHFGKNDKDITWEKTDKVAALQKAAK